MICGASLTATDNCATLLVNNCYCQLGTEGAYASVQCYAYMPVCKYAELKYTSCNKSLLLLVEHYMLVANNFTRK